MKDHLSELRIFRSEIRNSCVKIFRHWVFCQVLIAIHHTVLQVFKTCMLKWAFNLTYIDSSGSLAVVGSATAACRWQRRHQRQQGWRGTGNNQQSTKSGGSNGKGNNNDNRDDDDDENEGNRGGSGSAAAQQTSWRRRRQWQLGISAGLAVAAAARWWRRQWGCVKAQRWHGGRAAASSVGVPVAAGKDNKGGGGHGVVVKKNSWSIFSILTKAV